jgi:hypothetical protein
MSPATWLGFTGDALTFAGGITLAIDALRQEQTLRKRRAWLQAIEDPELKGIVLTLDGIKIRTGRDIELSFTRKSKKLAFLGAAILTIGFLCLFVSRYLEIFQIR